MAWNRPRWARTNVPTITKAAPGGSWLPALPPGATTTDLRMLVQAMNRQNQQFETDEDGRPVQFGPGVPPLPQPLGADPRAYAFRTGWNIPSPPGEGKLVSWETLKSLPRIYEVMGKAIRLRCDEITTMHFDLIARDRGDSRKARETLAKQATTIAKIKDRLAKPDGRLTWDRWLHSLIYESLVTDTACVYVRRNLDPDAGPEDPVTGERRGEVVALERVDGTTIKPLLGPDGRRPLGNAPAYQQYLYGVARESFTSQDLIYAPVHCQVDYPYGFSPVEQMIMHVNMALRYWQSMSAIWTDGTLPEGVAEAPPDWSVEDLKQWNEEWDAMLAGDVRALRKLHFVPPGFKWHDFKQLEFNEPFARYIFDVTCVCLDVTSMEMGMEPSHGGLGGKGLGEVLTDVSMRRSIRPTIAWLFNTILNPIIWDEFGATDLEWTAVELDQQSEQDKAQAQDMNLRNGRVSLDELIEEDGGQPIGVGRLFVVGQTLYGEADLVAISTDGALAAGYLGPTPEERQQGLDIQAQAAAQKPAPDGGPSRSTGMGATTSSGSQQAKDDAQRGSATSTSGSTAKKLADLRRWETKVTKALRAGKDPASVPFTCDELPSGAQNLVRAGLANALEMRHVRRVFDDARAGLSFAELAEAG